VSEVLKAAEHVRELTKVERLEAPALAARLERHPETRARLLIDNQAGFQTWGLCEELISRSRKAIFDGEPQRAVRISRLAVAVAERLDENLYSGGLADDMRGRTWGSLGNAYRCSSQFDAAGAAFVQAAELLEEGSGDPLEQANLYSLRASLAHWMGDLDETIRILDRADTIYSELDEHALRGKILIQKANAAGFQDTALGIECAQAAEKVIDPNQDEHLYLLARHAHIFWLVESGQPERAKMLLDASRHFYRRHGDTWFTIRLAGVEARILFAFGALEEAEAGLRVVLNEFSDRELHLDSLICALDIAACRLAQGDAEGAADIAAAMVPHLRECGAHNHAREAWALFRHALSIHRASQELVREVKSYLQLAWKNPRLRFSSRLTAGSGPV
jgi:tetratricopeptide (TPR) repeat protein